MEDIAGSITTKNLNALVNYARLTIGSEIFLIYSPEYLALAILEEDVLANKCGFVNIIAASKNFLSLEIAIDEIYEQISR